jgi:nucleoside-diphosphate-sugar epimerase
MKVLFIGGTGVISSACTDLAINMGIELYLLNRGNSPRIPPKSAELIKADIRNIESVKYLIDQHIFDVVVDWIAYDRIHVENDFELFKDKTSQYIFISSASAYQKTPTHLPIKETNPLNNPFWEYSQKKILCEDYLLDVYEAHQFPVTIVRPSHTYDKTKIPLHGGYTTIYRMEKGKQIIIHDSGTSLWTLTHHKDFAKGFLGLVGNSGAIGEAYHITSDEVLTWDEICEIIGETIGMAPQIIHIPSDFIRRFDKEWGDGLLGDKAHNMVFDNSKIKKINPEYSAVIPFREGAREIISWYMADQSRKQFDWQKDQKMDEIIKSYVSA